MNKKMIKNVNDLKQAYNSLPKKYQKMVYKLELSENIYLLPHTCILNENFQAVYGGNVLDFNTSLDLYNALKNYTKENKESYIIVSKKAIVIC